MPPIVRCLLQQRTARLTFRSFVLAALLAPAAFAAVSLETASGQPVAMLTFSGTKGRPEKIAIDGFAIDGRPVGDANKLQARTLSPGVTELTAEAPAVGEWTFGVADDSACYGFGERFDRLNHAHTIIRNASRDVPGDKGSSTYKPVPFFMSLRGYGLWVDTTSDALFDLNVTDASRIRISLYGDKLRVVLIEGPKFPVILDRFTGLIGRQQLPPYWAFAPWKSRDYYTSQKEIYEDIEKYRELGLPASVILIDSPWATNYNTYAFNPKQFENPARMIADLHSAGYKLILWHTPWINNQTATPREAGFAGKIPPEAENFSEAERAGYFVHRPDGSTYIGQWWKGTGALIDFTNPAAKRWWQSQVSKAIAMGADGFKDDDAEGNFLGDVRFASGVDQRIMRNRYAVEYNHAVAEALTERKGKDWVLLQRSGTVGSQMLPLFWGGDNDATFSTGNGLPTVVTAGLNAGLSGMSLWMGDLGGYLKERRFQGDDVLFARWTEYSAFSPGMEVISTMNLGPWDYGEEALSIFRQYSLLHMSLFPYRYAAAQESARNGLPMMRALVLMHQDDRAAREAETEYYFGPDLLVAPVLTPVAQRAVYFPAGDWIDYWTGQRYTGPRSVTFEMPLNLIPLYVRAGAILPKIPEDVMTLVPQSECKDTIVKSIDNRRIYEIYPDAAPRAITDFEGRTIGPGPEPNTLTITGPPARITLRWRFRGPGAFTVNARKPSKADGGLIEFDHVDTTTVRWKVRTGARGGT